MLKTQSLFLVFFSHYFTVTAQVLNVTFGFINVATGTGIKDPGPWPSLSGMEFRPFTAYGVSAQPEASGRFAFNGWPTGASSGVDDELQFNGTLSGLSYYEFRVVPQPGFSFYLNAISFHVRRSSTGIRHFCVRSSADDFTANLSATTGTNLQIAVRPTNYFFWQYDSISVSGDQKGCAVLPAQIINDSLTVRFYAWNAESAGGSFSLDNVSVSGRLINLATLGCEDTRQSEPNRILYDYERTCFCLSSGEEADWFLFSADAKLMRSEKKVNCFRTVETKSGLIRCLKNQQWYVLRYLMED